MMCAEVHVFFYFKALSEIKLLSSNNGYKILLDSDNYTTGVYCFFLVELH